MNVKGTSSEALGNEEHVVGNRNKGNLAIKWHRTWLINVLLVGEKQSLTCIFS